MRALPCAAWIAVVTVISACSSQPTQETSAQLCADRRDNDLDGFSDCDDPDCQAYDRCAGADGDIPARDAGQKPPPMSLAGSGGGGGGGGRSGGGGIGGSGGVGGLVDEDAGWLPPAEPPDPSDLPCMNMCAATQACINDRCEDVSTPTSGAFELVILSATLPIFDFTTRCYDIDCGGSPFATCRCMPDPYVRAVRIRGSDEREVGITSAVTDATNPTFSDPGFTIQLEPGDALQLEVWDSDPQPEPDELVYQCTADLRMLMGGPIECSTVVLIGFPPYRVSAELRPVI
jgi:hypothetical protein